MRNKWVEPLRKLNTWLGASSVFLWIFEDRGTESAAPTGKSSLTISTKPNGWRSVSAVDPCGRTIWIVDAHRNDGKRFVVHADEKLTAFAQLELASLSRSLLFTIRKSELDAQRRSPNIATIVREIWWQDRAISFDFISG